MKRSAATAAAATAVLLGMIGHTAEGFAPASAGLQSTSLRLRSSACALSMKERPDGASQKEVDAAWATYKDLMRSNNNGKGYWMDDPFQFFSNIKTAFARNFGDERSSLGLPSKGPQTIDFEGSPFKSLISAEDLEELGKESAPKAKAKAQDFPVEAELKVPEKKTKKKVTRPSSSADSDSTEGAPKSDEEKLAAIEAAKKKKAADAAALKAKLSE